MADPETGETVSLRACGQSVVGEPSPWFAGWTVDDQIFNIRKPFADDSVSRLALVFWATWCQPCKRGIDELNAAAQRIEAAGIAVVLVHYGESGSPLEKYLVEHPTSYPVVIDPHNTSTARFLTEDDGAVRIPKTVLIDRDGRVEAIFGAEGADYVDRIIAGR